MERSNPKTYSIRVYLDMLHETDENGNTMPVAFHWEGEDGEDIVVEVDEVLYMQPLAELKTGNQGDRYECRINGKILYLWFEKRQPRRWFLMKPVTKEEYMEHYPLPGE